MTLTDPAELSGSCRDKLADAADYALARGVLMIGVTPVALADSVLSLGARHIPLYNIDGTTLKSLIRAHQGLVVIKEGTILAKWNCRDIPDLNGENAEQSILSLVAAPCRAGEYLLVAGRMRCGVGVALRGLFHPPPARISADFCRSSWKSPCRKLESGENRYLCLPERTSGPLQYHFMHLSPSDIPAAYILMA